MQDDSTNVNSEPGRVSVPNAVPWSGRELLFALYLVWYFWPLTAYLGVTALGVEHWYYGDDAGEMQARLSLWSGILALPMQLLTIPLLFSAFSQTRLDQLGLTTRRFGRNVLLGLAGALLLAPPVFGINYFLRYLYSQGGDHVERHVLEKIAQHSLFPTEWILLFFAAMVSAPLVEELIFRGVLQPWLAARRWGGHVAMLGALVLAVVQRWERLRTAWPEGVPPLMEAAAPVLFVLALLPLYLLVWRLSRTPVAPAIFGTSLMFACIHSAWPTPIPLFVLALGLGVLAQRTRSLVGPIVLHSLFNGVSCVQLLSETLISHR
ncbi:MAG TPA: CPBP family intramembrane glutamic endopeptidase [Gemmataceae bacterium]|nr:CPBP family intramembrane glutamic endopeptidase [Gemmataceae bacterium]